MKKEKYICSAAIGSVTQAMKAQHALSDAAIPCEVIKSERKNSKKGCIYGISFACSQNKNVQVILKNAKIQVKEWEEDKL